MLPERAAVGRVRYSVRFELAASAAVWLSGNSEEFSPWATDRVAVSVPVGNESRRGFRP